MKITLNEILEKAGRKESDIKKIYRGKDNYCRCGCGGKYYDRGEKGFTRAINEMSRDTFTCLDVEAPVGCNFINIPYDDSTYEGKALTIYFN